MSALTEIECLRAKRDATELKFADACRQLSAIQKVLHAARNAKRAAQRAYIDAIERRVP